MATENEQASSTQSPPASPPAKEPKSKPSTKKPRGAPTKPRAVKRPYKKMDAQKLQTSIELAASRLKKNTAKLAIATTRRDAIQRKVDYQVAKLGSFQRESDLREDDIAPAVEAPVPPA